MTKLDFIKIIAANNDLTYARATAIVDDMLEIIMNNIKRGEKVVFTGFGAFVPVTHAAKLFRNPGTGEISELPEINSVNFKLGKNFKELLNK